MGKSLVINQITKNVLDSGKEIVINTQEKKINYSFLLQKEIFISKDLMSLDKDTFIGEMGENYGVHRFEYNGEEWIKDNNTVNLEDYGIGVESANKGDAITVIYFQDEEDESIILKYAFARDYVAIDTPFDYVDIVADNPTVVMVSASEEVIGSEDISNVFAQNTDKFTAEFSSSHLAIKIENNPEKDIVVNIIVANKVD